MPDEYAAINFEPVGITQTIFSPVSRFHTPGCVCSQASACGSGGLRSGFCSVCGCHARRRAALVSSTAASASAGSRSCSGTRSDPQRAAAPSGGKQSTCLSSPKEICQILPALVKEANLFIFATLYCQLCATFSE